MKQKIQNMIREKDDLRGLVPASGWGVQDKVYGAYLDRLNPRENEKVKAALASSNDPRFRDFLDRISVPRYNRCSMQAIAKACRIGLGEFQKWWNQAAVQTAIAIAQEGSIRVTEDMVEDAQSRLTVCDRCDGMGWVAAPQGLPDDTPGYRPIYGSEDVKFVRTCPNCNGGKVRTPGDPHARDRVLEMSGILQRGKPMVTINQSFPNHAAAMESMNSMTIDIAPEPSPGTDEQAEQ